MKALIISLITLILSLTGFTKASNQLHIYFAKGKINKALAGETAGSNGRQMRSSTDFTTNQLS